MPHNVFISWSGERSGKTAEHLSMWLPRVIQRVNPWVSKADLYKGQRWFSELADALETGDVGILCVTRENKEAPWLLFEAGSLAKKGKARVFPYLLDMEFSELPDPLRQFNAVKAEKEDTYRMLESINDIVAGDRLPQEVCRASFDKWWPDLDALLKKRAIEELLDNLAGITHHGNAIAGDFQDVADKARADYLRPVKWYMQPVKQAGNIMDIGAAVARHMP